nr:HTH domain-containing protein [Paenibacillus sp. P3E]
MDRLLGKAFYLLNRETVSARVLAENFEVLQRTIQRDID